MQLAQYLKQNDKSARDVARWCGVTLSVAYKWIAGTTMPRPHNLQTIARKTNNAVTATDFSRTYRARAAQ